jgi:hypothetical protein
MRAFDARTTSSREADLMAALDDLQRAALREPEHAAALFEQARDLVPAVPLKIQIQTTTRCNAACAMCPYPLVAGAPGFEHAVMSEDRYRRILDELRGTAVERLSLFLMNEPLLDTRLVRWVALARDALPGTVLGLFSNGAALDGARARDLAAAGLDELCISVHGFQADTYEAVMGGLSYARLQRNLDEVLAAEAAGQLGTLRWQIVTGDVPEIAASPDRVPLRYRGRVALKAFSNEREAVGVGHGLSSSPACASASSLCQRLFVKLYVLTTGDCVLCNVDWRRTVLVGRVGDRDGPSVGEVWHAERYTEVRRDHFLRRFEQAAICRRCDYARVVDRE